MKKLTYFLIGAATLALGSCSQDEIASVGGNDGNFHITVKLPSNYSTRGNDLQESYNNGLQAVNLLYAVYDADNASNDLVLTGQGAFKDEVGASLTTTLNLKLATGKTYNVALFATAEDINGEKNVYTFDPETYTLTVSYENMNTPGMVANTYDCFYNVVSTGMVSSTNNEVNATLYRPIAQLNWGTNDLTETVTNDDGTTSNVTNALNHEMAFGENGKYIVSNLTVTNAYNTLNLLTGDVTGDPQEISILKLANSNTQINLNYPVEGYQYVAMQYVLAPKTSSTNYNLTLNISNAGNDNSTDIENDVEVVNVPVQANFQTNIYGSLLSDNVTINVTKSPNWVGAFYAPQEEEDQVTDDNGNLVDGLYKYVDSNTNVATFLVTSPTGLEYYANNVSDWMYDRNVIVIGADIDLSGLTHTAFYLGDGEIDGQGHTISNMTVKASGITGDSQYAGFISVGNGTIRNLNFVNAKVTGNSMSGVVVGDGVAATIDNVNVYNSTVTVTPYLSGGNYTYGVCAGAIAGYVSSESTSSITNCTVDGCTIQAYNVVGGLVGRVNVVDGNPLSVENNTISNTTVIANQYVNGTYEVADNVDSGLQIGQVEGNNYNNAATIQNNTTDNVTTLVINEDKELEVSTIEDLQAIAQWGQKNYSGETITFAEGITEIDLNGATIEPIQFGELSGGDYGATFNGNGVTIKNFTIDATGHTRAALFNAFGGSFSNLNIEDMTIETDAFFSSAGLIGYMGNGSITDVNVKNSKIITAGENSAAILGLGGGVVTISGCTVEGCEISDVYSAGAIMGYLSEGSATISNCSVSGTTIKTTTENAGGIFVGVYQGQFTPNVTYGEGNSVSESTVNGAEATVPAN